MSFSCFLESESCHFKRCSTKICRTFYYFAINKTNFLWDTWSGSNVIHYCSGQVWVHFSCTETAFLQHDVLEFKHFLLNLHKKVLHFALYILVNWDNFSAIFPISDKWNFLSISLLMVVDPGHWRKCVSMQWMQWQYTYFILLVLV